MSDLESEQRHKVVGPDPLSNDVAGTRGERVGPKGSMHRKRISVRVRKIREGGPRSGNGGAALGGAAEGAERRGLAPLIMLSGDNYA